MAFTQKIKSVDAARALALFGVFAIAKLATLIGRPIQFSAWTPIAYFWQDALVAFAFYLFELAVRRARVGWALYAAAVVYAAINVPVARTLSTPLTRPMLGAAGGALTDSIRHHATAQNLLLLTLVLASGIALPLLLRPFKTQSRIALIIVFCLLAPLGPWAASRLDTLGMGRNAIMAMGMTSLPRIRLRGDNVDKADDWRASPFNAGDASDNLAEWRGSASGRNVVLIVLESTGAEYLKLYGATRDPMPNLSGLAREAIVFENAYAVYPESIKALFSTLCSRYPAMDTETEEYARIKTAALPQLLKSAGYRTALFHSGRFMYLGMKAVVENRGFEVLEDAGSIGGNHESSFGVDEPSTVRRALAWIDSLPRGERFFLTYLPIAGHHPYETPEQGPFPETPESDRYLNALHYSDASLGVLLKGLKERDLHRNTLFVIFGDHGQAFGRRPGNYGHTIFIYDENIRVPYLIAMPGLIDNQARVYRTMSLIDTAPTILDLLGLPSPADYQGSSAIDSRPEMALFYTDYSLGLLGLRDGDWKYIYEMDSGRSKLFDLRRDAAELNDLSGFHTDRARVYRDLLKRWSAAQKSLILNQIESGR